tara:strand:- start:238 stop:720 length:483 start_codon:yes stop_codon:yes gene_type:complete
MVKKILTHINKNKSPKMVDIIDKKISKRLAVAEGIIKFKKETFYKISKLRTLKGEVKNIAILSGIVGAKKTSELIPLCHNIPIDNIEIKIEKISLKYSIKVICEVRTSAKTGVEMEALTGVAITCLTIYDMYKSVDKEIIIKKIKLVKKYGGKTGYFESK